MILNAQDEEKVRLMGIEEVLNANEQVPRPSGSLPINDKKISERRSGSKRLYGVLSLD
jgi:hypothetical protein